MPVAMCKSNGEKRKKTVGAVEKHNNQQAQPLKTLTILATLFHVDKIGNRFWWTDATGLRPNRLTTLAN